MISQGFNRILIVGRVFELGKYVEKIKLFTSTIKSVSVWKNKNTQEIESHEQMYQVCFYQELANKARLNLKENTLVWIIATLKTKSWMNPELLLRYRTEFIANELEFPECPNCGGNANHNYEKEEDRFNK